MRNLNEFYNRIQYGYRIRRRRRTVQIGIESSDPLNQDLGTFIQMPIDEFVRIARAIFKELNITERK